jgi:acetyltransferase-like isoleucine patch superfamily enzyme
LITDTDFHAIQQNGEQINPDQPIIFGDRVWIGMRSTILKGAKIANDIVIGANSLVAHNLNQTHSIYAGQPAKKIKDDISWNM